MSLGREGGKFDGEGRIGRRRPGDGAEEEGGGPIDAMRARLAE